jgi:hypothetical protein
VLGPAALLILIGLTLVVPRGSTPGSAAARNIDMGLRGIHRTPGYQGAGDSRRRAVVRVLVGLALIGLGILGIAVATS